MARRTRTANRKTITVKVGRTGGRVKEYVLEGEEPTIADALEAADISSTKGDRVRLNGDIADEDTVVEDGDIITVAGRVSGGSEARQFASRLPLTILGGSNQKIMKFKHVYVIQSKKIIKLDIGDPAGTNSPYLVYYVKNSFQNQVPLRDAFENEEEAKEELKTRLLEQARQLTAEAEAI